MTKAPMRTVLWGLLLVVLVPGGMAWAQKLPLPPLPPSPTEVVRRTEAVADAVRHILFTEEDRRQIERYYRDADSGGKRSKDKKAPPGLAKRDRLPPGLEKQLQRNGTLPPGLQGRGLPGDLERRLSPLPAGYIRQRVENDIVLIEQATRVIRDVIHDVGRR